MELSIYEMQEVQAGLNKESCAKAEKFLAVAGLVSTIGSCFGPVGLAIFGPTSLGIGVIATACAFS